MDMDFSWNGNQRFQLMVSPTPGCWSGFTLCSCDACVESTRENPGRLFVFNSICTMEYACCQNKLSLDQPDNHFCDWYASWMDMRHLHKLATKNARMHCCADQPAAQAAGATGHWPHDCPLPEHAGRSVRPVHPWSPAHHPEAPHESAACGGRCQGV